MGRYCWILSTLLLAILLTMLPLSHLIQWVQPAWVLLVLIYWSIVLPDMVSVGVAWLSGIVVDLLTGTILGQHAFAYTVMIYCVDQCHLYLQRCSLLQQSIAILILVSVYQFVVYCIQGFIGELPHHPFYWLAIVTSTLLWPWLTMLLRAHQAST